MGTPTTAVPASKGGIASFFGKIFGWIHHAEQKVNETFVALFGPSATLHFWQGAEQILKTDLGILAKDAVLASEVLVGSAEKRAAAVSKLGTDALAAGKTVPASLLNLLVELAVQAFTATKA